MIDVALSRPSSPAALVEAQLGEETSHAPYSNRSGLEGIPGLREGFDRQDRPRAEAHQSGSAGALRVSQGNRFDGDLFGGVLRRRPSAKPGARGESRSILDGALPGRRRTTYEDGQARCASAERGLLPSDRKSTRLNSSHLVISYA